MNRSESVDNTCPLCHDVVEIYAIGPCDHPVCYRCSTRMRVLCEKADCPICRSLMPQVAFVHEKLLFKDISLRDCIPNRKNKIFYEDEEIEGKYLSLLEFKCRLCPRKPERTFVLLQTHMRREHQLFACDLCLSHLKIFPYERKFYDRKNLAIHRRLGDPDDKSYKGHPLCEFCDVRYNDKDELLKHLRKDHYFCHFCDQQGSNAYYNEYPDLKQHFGESHFLCTEDVCGHDNTQFTHAFSSEIDLKAHKAKMHSKNMSKFQSRETRQIDIDFQYNPRRQGFSRGATNSDSYDDTSSYRNKGDRYNNRRQQKNNSEDPQLLKALAESLETAAATPPVQERVPDPVHDFPSLNGMPAVQNSPSHAQKPLSPVEDFPSLKSVSSQAPHSQPKQQQSKAYSSVMNFSMESNPKPAPKEKSDSKPIVLGTVSTKSKDRLAFHAPQVTDENFPSLNGKISIKVASDINLTSGWSKSHSNEPVNNVNIVASKPMSEETSKKVKYKAQIHLDKKLGDEKEFPSLGPSLGVGGESNIINNSSWPNPNSNSNKKINSKPPKERVDDQNFELPESYYKAFNQNAVSGSDQSQKSKSKSDKKENMLNKTKDFPGLPPRDVKVNANIDKKQKVKAKEKPASAKAKKQVDASSSLNDIAQLLVIDDQPKKASGNKSGKASKPPPKSVASKSETDWFDNPPEVATQPSPKMSPQEKQKMVETDLTPPATIDNSFPSVHTMSTPVQDNRAPPGFSSNLFQLPISPMSAAPPGFAQPMGVPPGFTVMTVPAKYIQPAEFSNRNQKLIQDIFSCLNTIENGFKNFKTYSSQYRQGQVEAHEYYVKCQRLMGEDDFSKVFPELIALLPDVAKQQELWLVHQTAISNKYGKQASKSTAQSKALWSQLHDMSPCGTCGQIVLVQDLQHHNLQHGEGMDFPVLGKVDVKNKGDASLSDSKSSLKGAWIKAK